VLIKLTLAYDGTDFAGWQAQAAGRGRTVQGTLEEALVRFLGGERVAVAGAGRTDAGVHALGQVASLTLPRRMPAATVQRALNALLPPDVRVLEAAECAPGFHARKNALAKHYRYELDQGPVQLPTRRRLAAHVPFPLDAAAVREAAALVLGRHDFASLASSGGSVRTTTRTITRSEATFLGSTLVYDVEADGFLRKMVRSLVGGLIAAGRGALTPEDLRRALRACDRRAWPPPAEARGLTLVEVRYSPARDHWAIAGRE
jgi:tRNA pseudouridine38-40 synthase